MMQLTLRIDALFEIFNQSSDKVVKKTTLRRFNSLTKAIDGLFKAAYSVTIDIFRKIFFSFQIICKSRIKLCFQNKNVQYS